MPWLTSPSGRIWTPNSAQFLRRVSICVREVVSAIVKSSPRLVLNAGSAYPVGVLWSSVASVRSVRRPDLTLATYDHNAPTGSLVIEDPTSRKQVDTLRANGAEFGVPLHSMGGAQQ